MYTASLPTLEARGCALRGGTAVAARKHPRRPYPFEFGAATMAASTTMPSLFLPGLGSLILADLLLWRWPSLHSGLGSLRADPAAGQPNVSFPTDDDRFWRGRVLPPGPARLHAAAAAAGPAATAVFACVFAVHAAAAICLACGVCPRLAAAVCLWLCWSLEERTLQLAIQKGGHLHLTIIAVLLSWVLVLPAGDDRGANRNGIARFCFRIQVAVIYFATASLKWRHGWWMTGEALPWALAECELNQGRAKTSSREQ